MNNPASLRINFSFNVLLSVLNVIYPVVTLAYISRIFGPEILGKFYMAMSTATYFLLLAGVGIPLYGARAVARVRDDPTRLSRIFSELILLNAASSCASFLLFLGMVMAVPAMSGQLSLYLAAGAMILLNAFSTDFLFVGLEDFRNIAIRNLLARLCGMALMLAFVREKTDFLLFTGITILVVFVANALGFLSAARRVEIRFHGLDFRQHIRTLSIFGAILVATAIYTNLDSVMLGFLDEEREVGLYNAGLRISKIVVAVVTSAGIVLVARLTHYLEEGLRKEFDVLSKKSMDLILFLGVPVMVFLWMGAGEIVSTAFGAEFAGASATLRITAPIILVIGVTNCVGLQILLPNGQEKTLLKSAIAAALVDVALNFLLIPRYGAAGAAVATLAAETTLLCFQLSIAWTRYSLSGLFDRRTAAYLLAGGAFAAPFLVPLTGIESPLFRLAVHGALGAVCHFGLLSAMKDPFAREIFGLGRRALGFPAP